MSVTSIFIPHLVRVCADKCFTEVFVAITFQQQRVARVSRVDIVPNRTSSDWYSAFVHVEMWYSSSKGNAIHNKIRNAVNGHIYYAPSKYWVLCPDTIPPPPQLKRSPLPF